MTPKSDKKMESNVAKRAKEVLTRSSRNGDKQAQHEHGREIIEGELMESKARAVSATSE
jgi:hypothetical protein